MRAMRVTFPSVIGNPNVTFKQNKIEELTSMTFQLLECVACHINQNEMLGVPL